MEINLTAMTPEMTRQLNHIAEQYRKPYTEFIDELSDIYDDETGFWWDTPLASRNIYICRNFLDICTLRLAMDIARQGHQIRWGVSERGLRQALRDNIGAQDIQLMSGAKSGLKAKAIEKILGYSWTSSEYAFFTFQRWIRKMQGWVSKRSLEAFHGRNLTLVSTCRVPAETKTGALQDRYFPGLKENSDEDIVFLALSVFDSEAEGKQLLDVLHANEDHICIEEWIEPNDFQEVREYIRWCRKINVPRCMFDGMDVTALVKAALCAGAADNNAMYGVVKGRALCRLVEQHDLKIKCLIDWYEGQPSSNAMIRRFRAVFPNVPTVACSPFPYSENWLSLFPSELQVEKKVVPEYFSVMGKAWRNQISQFSKDVKCIVTPSFRHGKIFDIKTEGPFERKGILLVLPYFMDAATQMLRAFCEVIQEVKPASIGPIYIKNHPVHQKMRISDYGVADSMLRDWNVVYLTGDISEVLQKTKIVILAKTTSTLEAMLSDAYAINFIPVGDLSRVSLPENARQKITLAYNKEDLCACLQAKVPQGNGLSATEAEQLREESFTRVNRKTVADFLNLRVV